MKHVQLTTGRPVAWEAEGRAAKPRKSVFKLVFEAMHHTRRLQAEHTLHQYRHLIAQAESDLPAELKDDRKPEIINNGEKAFRHDSWARLGGRAAKISIGIVAIAFIVLHVIGGWMLQGSSQPENVSEAILGPGFD